MRLSLCLLLVPLAGCVRLQWGRTNVHTPVPEVEVAALEVGADLQQCLDRLGAPLRVWETGEEIAMSYGWLHSRDLGVKVSYSLADFVPVSFSYDNTRSRMRGAVLWFDRNLKLVRARTGWLNELAASPGRNRPGVIVEDS